MKKLHLAVIGCGRIGKMHVDKLLTGFPHVTVKAIVDSQLDRSWAQSRNIPLFNKQQLDKVLADDAIQAVIIAASSSDHVELIKQAAQAGKHIYCEKPIAFTPEDIQMAIDAVNQAGVKLQVGYNRRFDADFLKVKRAVATGKIGQPHIIKITNRDPKRPDLDFILRSGGLFLDFNVHDFDMARFITDSEVKNVYAMGANLVDPKIGECGDIDTAVISLTMKNAAMCVIDVSREALYDYDQRLEVFGNKGCIAAENTTPTRTILATNAGVISEKPHYSFVERFKDAYLKQFEAFFAAVLQDKPVLVSDDDALKAITIALAAKQSYQTNKPVEVTT